MSQTSELNEPVKTIVSLAKGAKAVDVSERTIRRWIADGTLTGYRFGPRLLRVDLNEVEALLRPVPTTATQG